MRFDMLTDVLMLWLTVTTGRMNFNRFGSQSRKISTQKVHSGSGKKPQLHSLVAGFIGAASEGVR